MIQVCTFCDASDIEKSVPDLSVDIAEMMATHVVVGGPGEDVGFTKETSVEEVGHYLRDKIQTAVTAMRLGASMAAAAQKEVNPKGE